MKKFTRTETIRQTVGLRFKHDIVIKKFRTEDGLEHEFTTWGNEGGRAGAVLALTPDKQVVTVRQFRAGPERWMYDIPGGGFEKGEDPEAGARRELAEETGYRPGSMTFLGTSSRDGYCNMTWYFYLATDCVPLEQGAVLDAEELEQGAETQLISIAQLIANAKTDKMSDPHAVLMAYDTLKELMK